MLLLVFIIAYYYYDTTDTTRTENNIKRYYAHIYLKKIEEYRLLYKLILLKILNEVVNVLILQ